MTKTILTIFAVLALAIPALADDLRIKACVSRA